MSTQTQPTVLGYTQHGTGPQHVLVLHDWNGDHTTYDPILPYLDGSTFTYAFVDLRGYGTSRDIAGDYTVNEISEDCFKVADALGWRRFHVIGHSMTGMVTQRMAVDAPSRIRSAIAVCPISAAGSQATPENMRFLSGAIENDDTFRRLIKFMTGNLSDQWAHAKLRQNRATVQRASAHGYLQMFATANFADEVKGLETPYLVVIAERDPGLNEAAMQKTFLAWHPNAELLVIRNCGHYPMQECPPYFATVIENFFRKQIA